MSDTLPSQSSTSQLSSTSPSTQPTKSTHTSFLNADQTNAGESDADSGIVAVANGKRIGSTSSDEDQSGHELSPTQSGSDANTKRMSATNFQRVRFDDELEMSEQNMRRSCKKLFATLYTPTKSHTIHRTQPYQPMIKQISQSHCKNSHKHFNCCDTRPSCTSLLPKCYCRQFSQTLQHKKVWPNHDQLKWTVSTAPTSNSELHLNVDKESSNRQYCDLLLQTIPQVRSKDAEFQTNSCEENFVKPMKPLESSRVKSTSCWAINHEFATNFKALESIKSMSDPFESASLVHAFAKPIIVNPSESTGAKLRLQNEPIYETIYPQNDIQRDLISCIDTINANQCKISGEADKSDNLKSDENDDEKVEDDKEKEYTITTYTKIPGTKRSSLALTGSKSIPSLVANEALEYEQHYGHDGCKVQPTKSILRKSSLKRQCENYPTCSLKELNYGLPPDEIYPREYEFKKFDANRYDSDSEDDENVEYAMVNKQSAKRMHSQDKFSHSYSAGDIAPKIPPKALATRSELNLNEIGQEQIIPEKKSFLQRFKSFLGISFSKDSSDNKSSANKTTRNKPEKTVSRAPTTLIQSKLDLNSSTSPNKSPFSKSPLAKSFRRMSFRRNVKINVDKNSPEKKIRWKDEATVINQNKESPAKKTNVWGELLKLNSNGSQVVQVNRQPGKPFGFFVARGTVNSVKGVFVSRMRDEETQKALLGVLEIGDEILEIDQQSVKTCDIMHVNQLIANKLSIRMTVMPYVSFI